MATRLLLMSGMTRLCDAIALPHERSLILKGHDSMGFVALAKADIRQLALYCRSDTPESVAPLWLVRMMVLFIGYWGVTNRVVRSSMREIAGIVVHLAKPEGARLGGICSSEQACAQGAPRSDRRCCVS